MVFPVGKAMAKKSIDRSEMTFVPFAGTTLANAHDTTNSLSQHELDAEVVAKSELTIGKVKGLILALNTGKLVVFDGLYVAFDSHCCTWACACVMVILCAELNIEVTLSRNIAAGSVWTGS